jgi:hypothetical protein
MTQTNDYERLAALTKGYARFARSAAGLGTVLGGVLLLAMWAGSNLLDLDTGGRLALATFPIVWIVAKELLRRRYYLRHGLVRDAWEPAQRRWHIGFTAFTAAVASWIVFVVIRAAIDAGGLPPGKVGYLAFVIAMPACVWWFMRSTEEFLVGVVLFSQAAVIVAGGEYPWWNLHFAAFALISIVAGFKQHRDYLKLDRALT